MHLCKMKVLNVIFILELILFSTGCTDLNISETDAHLNVKNRIQYAKTLEIYEDATGCKVHIYNPDTKKTVRLYLAKTAKNIPENYQYIQTPISSIITLSGTQIGMLSELNSLDLIVGVSSKTIFTIHSY